MKSQSNSQSELDKILKHHVDLINDAEAKRQLLQLALSCLPEKKGHKHNTSWEAGFDAAIDTIEQSIRAKFQ